MPLENNDTLLPFADYDFAIDTEPSPEQIPKATYRPHKKKKPYSNPADNKRMIKYAVPSYIYFENTDEENNRITLIPYTGPRNTNHLGNHLYLPQVVSINTANSSVAFQHFVEDYTRTITSMQSATPALPISIYLRFGIFYILQPRVRLDRTISLRDFILLRAEGKQLKTSFYTCKGVTTPKKLLATITTLNYRQVSSNVYSYGIQLHGSKKSPYSVLLFRYDENLRCQSVSHQASFPTNFNFIRDKLSSKFQSTDYSYADVFDFRVQLTQDQALSPNDPHVLETLRGVPIDSVLSFEPSTRVLHISPKLRKFVKYFKCTRSTTYENPDERILLSIGIYEEFQLNRYGQCEPLMTASNTMTMEFLNTASLPSAKVLYDTGTWFSTLCQACVELPSASLGSVETPGSNRWFSGIAAFRKKRDRFVAAVNVNELTKYKMRR